MQTYDLCRPSVDLVNVDLYFLLRAGIPLRWNQAGSTFFFPPLSEAMMEAWVQLDGETEKMIPRDLNVKRIRAFNWSVYSRYTSKVEPVTFSDVFWRSIDDYVDSLGRGLDQKAS